MAEYFDITYIRFLAEPEMIMKQNDDKSSDDDDKDINQHFNAINIDF